MTAAKNATEFAALDTNKDGVYNNEDDGYAPFYPGSQYVDWVGLSTYWFGATSPYVNNVVATAGYMEQYCHGTAVGGYGPDFYNTYALGDNKPFFITETAAALHEYTIVGPGYTNVAEVAVVPVGPGEVALKQSWWQQSITNTTFLDNHPMLKAISLFEWEKPEEVTMRDFRITNKTDVLAAFKTDFAPLMSRYSFGTYASIVTDPFLNPNQTVSTTPTTQGGGAGAGAQASVAPAASSAPSASSAPASQVGKSAAVRSVSPFAPAVAAFAAAAACFI
ncbi:hypothetical protein HKX48_003901 [Thoreauomyces humboldtii]|nr:hypothetical protein HKX48_003901 [Thoreauomyces humboldtii]